MHLFEQQLVQKAKKIINKKSKRLRDFETYIVDLTFCSAIHAIEELEEKLQDIVIFNASDIHFYLDHLIGEELNDVEVMKNDALNWYESCMREFEENTSDEEALTELISLIDLSKHNVRSSHDNFTKSIRRLTKNLTLISNIKLVEDQLRGVNTFNRNSLKNLENFPHVVTVDNAKAILAENFEKLHFSLEENFQSLLNFITKIKSMSQTLCSDVEKWSGCESSSDDEEEVRTLYSDGSGASVTAGEKSQKKTSECFQLPPVEHTRMDSIEKLKTDADELQQQRASIEEEIARVQRTIDEKRSGVLEAILKVVNLEELIEEIENAMADELHHFQTKIIAIETQMMENFKSRKSDETENILENQLQQVKQHHEDKSKTDDENYALLTRQAKVFASSIGSIVDEYKKFHDDSHEKFHYNIEKLNALLSRPAEFCKDSRGQRFFYNADKIKVFQADVHRSQHVLDDDGERIKIVEGAQLETDENGEFYVDVRGRKIYTKYFFENEHGRFYIDTHGFRHYQADPRASEYALVNGNWTKIKDGTYEVDEKGLRIPDECETREEEDEKKDSFMKKMFNAMPSKGKISAEDFKYIKESVGPILIKACAGAYLHKPSDPISYIANFLCHHRVTSNMFKTRESELERIVEMREEKIFCE